jgi:hypothetical protein
VFFVTRQFIDEVEVFWETPINLCLAAVRQLTDEQAAETLAAFALDSRESQASLGAKLRQSPLRLLRSCIRGDAQTRLACWLCGLKWEESELRNKACEVLGVDVRANTARRPVFMTTAQLRQLADEGFVIGGHGLSHRPLQGLPPKVVRREILDSCAFVRDVTGQKRVPFAFPYSGHGVDLSGLQALVDPYDFIDLFFDTGGLNRSGYRTVTRFWADFFDDSRVVSTNQSLAVQLQWLFSSRAAWYRQP